jgi:hypothetical protein
MEKNLGVFKIMGNEPMLDRVIFGDNQFFGINHMSEEKAQALAEKFRDLKSITDVIDIAYDCGIRAFMLNTHEIAKDICDHWRQNSTRFADLRLYPSMPYAHKYASAVAEKGIFGALKDIIMADSSVGEIAGMLTKGGASLFSKDMIKVMQLLVDIEMKAFRDLNVRVIFLQNIVTDLLLGFGVKDVFVAFASYIKEKYGAEPGFVTVNLPHLVNFLLECGIENPIVCSTINKTGYAMNPDKESYEKTIVEKEFHPMAMSIMASGAIKPKEAVEYVCRMPNIRSIVFGASSKQHIIETKQLIENYS